MTAKLLAREEYVEQAYFFCNYRERLLESVPSQEILITIREEILATTKLPLAIDFMTTEILHSGRLCESMNRLLHYFTPFQAFIMQMSEEDKTKFDQTTALQILQRQAEYLAKQPTPAGLFMYQFESIARNRLGYDYGMQAMSEDCMYNEEWSRWIRSIRFQLGTNDFADMIYLQSDYYTQQHAQQQSTTVTFSRPTDTLSREKAIWFTGGTHCQGEPEERPALHVCSIAETTWIPSCSPSSKKIDRTTLYATR